MRPGEKSVNISGIRWPRHTIQTLKCRHKSKLSTWDSTFAVAVIAFLSRDKAHSPLSWFPGGELSSYFSSSFLFSVANSSRTVGRTQTKNISKRASRSDSVCYYSVFQNINYVAKNCEKFPIRNEWDEVKKVVNLQRFSNISCSSIHSHRNTILALKCRHKSWVF